MNHLRGVLFCAFLLLATHALAEEGRGRHEFGLVLSEADTASGAQVSTSLPASLRSETLGSLKSASLHTANAEGAHTRINSARDSISQRYARFARLDNAHEVPRPITNRFAPLHCSDFAREARTRPCKVSAVLKKMAPLPRTTTTGLPTIWSKRIKSERHLV